MPTYRFNRFMSDADTFENTQHLFILNLYAPNKHTSRQCTYNFNFTVTVTALKYKFDNR